MLILYIKTKIETRLADRRLIINQLNLIYILNIQVIKTFSFLYIRFQFILMYLRHFTSHSGA